MFYSCSCEFIRLFNTKFVGKKLQNRNIIKLYLIQLIIFKRKYKIINDDFLTFTSSTSSFDYRKSTILYMKKTKLILITMIILRKT